MAIVAAAAGRGDRRAGGALSPRAAGRADGRASPAPRPTPRCWTRSSAGAGGRPGAVKTITIGFNAVADLLAGRVAGADRVLERRGRDARPPAARLSRLPRRATTARPSYPELVLCATARRLQADPGLARGVWSGRWCAAMTWRWPSPRRGSGHSSHRSPGSTTRLLTAELRGAAAPPSAAPSGRFGVLDTALLRRWAAGRRASGSSSHRPTWRRAFDHRVRAATARGAS